MQEAIRIGDELIAKSIKEEVGLSWESMSFEGDEIVWRKSENIYSGVSGIVLFFIALYKNTSEKKYLDTAIQGARWAEKRCADTETTYYAFLTGRLGVAYMLMQLAAVSNEKAYLEKALIIAKGCEVFIKQPPALSEYINGAAGALLVLMHLHQASQEEWILDSIEAFTMHLLEGAHHGNTGLYWDRSSKNSKGLCGFSHGAAGVGYVFLELGAYFKNKAFYDIAEQAFQYENAHFNEKTGNWPDFRKGNYDETTNKKFVEAYLNNNKAFFEEASDMTAWCHGAPGIGLSRLRAFELLKKEEYREDYLKAEKKVLKTNQQLTIGASFNLCHGIGGNSILLLEAFRLFKDEQQLEQAGNAIEKLLNIKANNQVYLSGYSTAPAIEDSSLFMGNAGIGYFLLQFVAPEITPSILMPSLQQTAALDLSNRTMLGISSSKLRRLLIEKEFPGTCQLLHAHRPKELQGYLEQPSPLAKENVSHRFKSFVKEMGAKSPSENEKLLQDLFELEVKKEKLQRHNPSYLLTKNQVIKEKANALLTMSEEAFSSEKLLLNEEVELHQTSWNWGFAEAKKQVKLLSAEQGEYYTLILPEPEAVQLFSISNFTAYLFSSFKKEITVKQAISDLMDTFEGVSGEEEAYFTQTCLGQIREGVKSGILVG